MALNVPLKGLAKFATVVAEDLRGAGQGPFREALRRWSLRYSAFIRRRFTDFSRGKGDWAPLAPATVRRKQRKKGGKVSILIDTGNLFATLMPSFAMKPGQLAEDIPFGVRIRPNLDKGDVGKIFKGHQLGTGHLPQRKIIVPPDQYTLKLMKNDMSKAIRQAKNL